SHACVILSKSFEHLASLLYTNASYRFANTIMITKESFAIVSLLLYLRVSRPVGTLLTQGSLND
ncbi:MAG: hypothetical protein VX551_05085, partial [Pseudomonadota bacterium]|nr:hypothetical protein [Pseudomonadota bacterium]